MIQLELEFFSRPPVQPQTDRPLKGGLVISVHEAARVAKVDPRHIYYALFMGEIEAWKVGWRWRIWRTSVEDYAFRRSA